MEIMKDLEKIAGAVAAVEGVKKLNPNAGIVTEAAAAITGFEATDGAVEKIEELIKEKLEGQ
jgi:hypothetical protein